MEFHSAFVYFENAFDWAPLEELWYCMRRSGVADEYVKRCMNKFSELAVKCGLHGLVGLVKVWVG